MLVNIINLKYISSETLAVVSIYITTGVLAEICQVN